MQKQSPMDRLVKEYSRRPVKGDIFRLAALKIVLDDVLRMYLTSVLGWEQSHLVSDIKILVGVSSIASAAALVYMSVYVDFAVYKPWAVAILAVYFSLNAILEAFLYLFPEPAFRGCKGGMQLVVRSSVKPPHPVYTLTVYRNGRTVPAKYTKSVCDLFCSNGVLLHEEYLRDIEELFSR